MTVLGGRQFIVRGIAGGRHPRCPAGTLLVETEHGSEASAAIEVEAWQSRMRASPGEVDHAQLIDCREGGSLTELRVYADTDLPWSWKGGKP